MNSRLLSSSIYLVLLWIPALKVIALEWKYNEQYHYGYFVPFLTLYLIYNRWNDRPESSRGTFSHRLALPIITALMIPLQLIETANPDWRFVYWLIIGTATIATLLLMDQTGGKKWLFHFTPAVAMILFSIPWFVRIENWITNGLMDIVSSITVEVITLSGIYAVKMGNVIRLPESIVGIEEACSGVRSLQSSIMGGYLFGELLRFRIIFRFLIITFGICLTFLLNIIRTISLTLITHHQGNHGYEEWHNTLGNSIAIFGFIGIALLAWFLSRKKECVNPSSYSPKTPISPKPNLMIASSSLLVMALLIDGLWFANAKKANTQTLPKIQWTGLGNNLQNIPIDPFTTAQLKYSEGSQYIWETENNDLWTAFYFKWDAGKISSHAGVHKPENCLPASGIQFLDEHELFLWSGPQNINLTFRVLSFKKFNQTIYVFFSVWDRKGDKPWFSYTWTDRLSDVINKRLVNSRYSLEFITENPDLTEAQYQLEEYLNTLYLQKTTTQ